MISKWRWWLDQLSGQLWVRATLFAIVGVATALVGLAADAWVPAEVGDLVSLEAVRTLLNVLASSMLAVTTFSLGVMISAYSAATSNVTPRATRLLRRDSTSQNVLSTFVGSFMFSLVSIVTLTVGGYGAHGRLVLFFVTIGVIVLVVAAILRWIDHVNGLGRVDETTALVERAANRAVEARRAAPCLGGHALLDIRRQVPLSALSVHPDRTGYVQHVDAEALDHWAGEHGAILYIACLPGALVYPGAPLGWIEGAEDLDLEERVRKMRSAFTVGDARTYEQDPRFGLVVLGEIASRALSPGINDPGTAIDVLGRQLRVLLTWANAGDAESTSLKCPHLLVPPIRDEDLLDDAFGTIARDGADKVEVQVRLQKVLAALAGGSQPGLQRAARQQSRLALARAEAAMEFAPDLERVRRAAAWAEL